MSCGCLAARRRSNWLARSSFIALATARGGTHLVHRRIVERIAVLAKQVFGCDPIVLGLPYAETLKSSDRAGFITLIAGW
jgi:hypothetical protein